MTFYALTLTGVFSEWKTLSKMVHSQWNFIEMMSLISYMLCVKKKLRIVKNKIWTLNLSFLCLKITQIVPSFSEILTWSSYGTHRVSNKLWILDFMQTGTFLDDLLNFEIWPLGSGNRHGAKWHLCSERSRRFLRKKKLLYSWSDFTEFSQVASLLPLKTLLRFKTLCLRNSTVYTKMYEFFTNVTKVR